MKLIIYADTDKLNLAIRAAELLKEDDEFAALVVGGEAIFSVTRNKSGSITVRQESAECSSVQMNTSKEHQMHETTPNAQQNVLPFTKMH